MKTEEKRSARNIRFRPGSTGVCEAQLWIFTGPRKVSSDDCAREVYFPLSDGSRTVLAVKGSLRRAQ